MSQELVPQSPFDALRRVDENGIEYWSSRELYPHSGYSEFSKFEVVIKRSMTACKNSGESIESHYAETSVVSKGFGPKIIKDYRLSRYAAYLTFMNGDPNNPQIAEAQSYFAIKTHEAEVSVPNALDSDLRQILQLTVSIQQTRNEVKRLEQVQGIQQATLINHAARLDGLEGSSDWLTARGFSSLYGIKNSDESSLSRLGKRASKLLRDSGTEKKFVKDQRHGRVGLYPEEVLVEAASQIGLE